MSGSPWDGGLFTFGFQGNHLSWGDQVLKARVRVGSPSLSIVELIGDGAPKGKMLHPPSLVEAAEFLKKCEQFKGPAKLNSLWNTHDPVVQGLL